MNSKAKQIFSENDRHASIEAFSAVLPALRAKAGLSQNDLSALVGISRQTYSAAESGRRLLSWNTYLSLIFFFDNCAATRRMLHSQALFPDDFFTQLNQNAAPSFSGDLLFRDFPASVRDRLDDRAIHTIRTVIMMEYARCTNPDGDEFDLLFAGS